MRRTARFLIVVMLLSLMPRPASAAELKVAGKSSLLMDVATGTVLYESNPHERLAPASVTKIDETAFEGCEDIVIKYAEAAEEDGSLTD